MNKTILKNLVNPVKAHAERSSLLNFLDDCIAHPHEIAVAHWRENHAKSQAFSTIEGGRKIQP